jgi:hypothetical protein
MRKRAVSSPDVFALGGCESNDDAETSSDDTEACSGGRLPCYAHIEDDELSHTRADTETLRESRTEDSERLFLVSENARLALENARLRNESLIRENEQLRRQCAEAVGMWPQQPGGAIESSNYMAENGQCCAPMPTVPMSFMMSSPMPVFIPQVAPTVADEYPTSASAGFAGSAHRLPQGASSQPEAGGPRTTVMLRNLPNNYTRARFLDMLDSQGFAGAYDFVYLPIDFSSQACLGYAFVNLSDPSVLPSFWRTFEGFAKWAVPSRKVCEVSWSGPHQGFDAHVERYRNSPVMHPSVPDECKPIVFQYGKCMPFPPPTKAIRFPRMRNSAKSGCHGAHNVYGKLQSARNANCV